MKRTILRLNSDNHTDMIIDVEKITFVAESKEGCIIHLDNKESIETTASFKEIADAFEQAVDASAD